MLNGDTALKYERVHLADTCSQGRLRQGINNRVFVVVRHRICLPRSSLGGQTEPHYLQRRRLPNTFNKPRLVIPAPPRFPEELVPWDRRLRGRRNCSSSPGAFGTARVSHAIIVDASCSECDWRWQTVYRWPLVILTELLISLVLYKGRTRRVSWIE